MVRVVSMFYLSTLGFDMNDRDLGIYLYALKSMVEFQFSATIVILACT